MKKILIFSSAYYPHIGGAEIAVKEITDRLSRDFEFDMITLNLDGQQLPVQRIGHVTVYRIGSKGKLYKLFYPFVAARRARILHKQKKYDAIWSIMASYSGFAALFFKKKHKNVPFVLTLQEGDPIDFIKHQVRFVYGWFKQIFTTADRIQTISNFLAKWAKDMGAQSEITVIPNGVDIGLFSESLSDTERELLKIALGKKPEYIFLITTSRLVIKNGIGDIIKALAFLPEHVKLLIIGEGELKNPLQDLVKESKSADRVLFLGQVPYSELPKYLEVSDIFIRPSLSEGMGNSFIEAMAAGLPVIGTNVGGIPDFLKHEETGLFCEINNPESIAREVKKLIENRELREKIITNGKKLVQEKHDWNLVAERMKIEIFAKV